MNDTAQHGPAILIIEDESKIQKFLAATLSARGYRPSTASTGREGLLQASLRPPDLVILDLGLPDMDGLEVTRQLRAWSSIPILVLSARGGETDKVSALDAGADDYITKPFSVPELAARVRVALRHAQEAGSVVKNPVFECGELRIDHARRQVFVRNAEVRLTPTEYKLLTLLAKHAGRVVTHQQLLTEVWGPAHATETQYLRVYMGQLRRKLEIEPARPEFIITEPGVGYRLPGE